MDEEEVLKEQEMQGETPEMPMETPVSETEAPEAENEMQEAEVEESPNNLIAAIQKYLPGEEITSENVNEKAVMVINRLSGIQDNLSELADEYPEFAMFLRDVMKGMPLEEAVARNFDELTTPPEGSPDWENINKGREQRSAMLGEKKSRLESLEKNKQVSIENADAFIKETGLDEANAMKFLDWFDNLNKDMFDGLISKEHFNTLYKAFNYDNDMANKDAMMKDEVEAAKIAGRNEQITARKMNAETGDGIPKLGSSGKAPTPEKKTFAGKFIEGAL